MIDRDPAELHGVETKQLKRQVEETLIESRRILYLK
jgi:hypothetical protein